MSVGNVGSNLTYDTSDSLAASRTRLGSCRKCRKTPLGVSDFRHPTLRVRGVSGIDGKLSFPGSLLSSDTSDIRRVSSGSGAPS